MQRMRSKVVLDIIGSQAVVVVVVVYVSETCDTLLDNGNRDPLKLTPQETDQS